MDRREQICIENKTIETADTISSKLLQDAQNGMGMIPNMYAGMANNTALFEGYISSYKSFRANSGFTPQEQEVVFLSISYENNCDYCMAAHSFVADNMTKVPLVITNAIRNNTDIPDLKLKALSIFSKVMLVKKGMPSTEDIDAFLTAGYRQHHILGVIAGLGVKTMSNYFNHIFKTPIDDAFKERTWVK